MNFSNIGLVAKLNDPKVAKVLADLIGYFDRKHLNVIIDRDTAESLQIKNASIGSRQDIIKECDLIVAVGGDGTLLNVARSISNYDVPLIGINMGFLGFLTDISPDSMLENMDQILQGKYQIEERFLLNSKIIRNNKIVDDNQAFNDIVIHKWQVARMIELEIFIDDKFVSLQRSDGVILATPTGSTAYALSAGGPIVHPALDAIILAPVCPHTMSNRPLVFNGNSKVDVIICEKQSDTTQMTCDGQMGAGLIYQDRIEIRKKSKTIKLIHPPQHDHFEMLRAKLKWS